MVPTAVTDPGAMGGGVAGSRPDARPAPAEASLLRRRARSAQWEHDVPVVRLVARGRVLVATAAVIVGSLLPGGNPYRDAVLYVVGLFWVPWSAWLALNADRYHPRFTRLGGAIADLAVLFVVASVISGALGAVAVACGTVVLIGAYTGGVREGTLLSAGAVVIVGLPLGLAPDTSGPGPLIVLAYAVLLMLLLLVIGRGSSQQRRASLQSERLLGRSEAILERVADGVLLTDATGNVLEANPAARRIMEYSGGPEGGRHCSEVLALGIGQRRLDCSRGCGLLALSGTPEGDAGHEIWQLMPDGQRRPLLANVCAITSRDGQVEEVVHSLRDITSLKQADEAKTLFLAMTSHELKTPLTVIKGFAEMLLDSEGLPEEAARAVDAITRRADELSVIVDGLLLSSRIEAGRLDLHPVALELAPLIDERVRSMAVATGRSIVVDVPSALAEVEADPGAVTTVVDHLLENAVKYSPDGGDIEVGAEVVGDVVLVRVSDSGVGMDSEQAAHCFDKFWQGESHDVRRFKGSGIGLYIVRSLVEAMGGSVGVESTLGRGSHFTVVLRKAGEGSVARPRVHAPEDRTEGDDSIVREFMRQLGIPAVRP